MFPPRYGYCVLLLSKYPTLCVYYARFANTHASSPPAIVNAGEWPPKLLCILAVGAWARIYSRLGKLALILAILATLLLLGRKVTSRW